MDIFVSTGTSRSGAAKAVLTFVDIAPAVAVYDVARTWYYNQCPDDGSSRRYWHTVKWWRCNYKDSEAGPVHGYGLAGAPPSSSSY